MPDARLRRTRPTLPEGYQYGDARPPVLRKFMELQIDGLHPRNPVTGEEIIGFLQWFQLTRDQYGYTINPRDLYPFPADRETPIPLSRVVNPRLDQFFIGEMLMSRPAMGCRIADDSWRAPHENAAAQLKRHADADAFKIGEPSNAGHLPQRFKAQRTGEEPV